MLVDSPTIEFLCDWSLEDFGIKSSIDTNFDLVLIKKAFRNLEMENPDQVDMEEE